MVVILSVNKHLHQLNKRCLMPAKKPFAVHWGRGAAANVARRFLITINVFSQQLPSNDYISQAARGLSVNCQFMGPADSRRQSMVDSKERAVESRHQLRIGSMEGSSSLVVGGSLATIAQYMVVKTRWRTETSNINDSKSEIEFNR